LVAVIALRSETRFDSKVFRLFRALWFPQPAVSGRPPRREAASKFEIGDAYGDLFESRGELLDQFMR